VERGSLEGKAILVVEREPLIALDLQRALEAAGAEVVVAGNAKEAVSRIRKSRFAAGVIDWHPSSEDHRLVARALKQASVRFLFYATHSPEDVTTVRGAPIFLKPGRPEDIVQALVMLTARVGGLEHRQPRLKLCARRSVERVQPARLAPRLAPHLFHQCTHGLAAPLS
jgi:DNA-binding response OmpR family regulator